VVKDLKGPKPVTRTWISRGCCSAAGICVSTSGRGVEGPASPIVLLCAIDIKGDVDAVYALTLRCCWCSIAMR